MSHGGNDFLHQILGAQSQAGGIDAGMAAKVFTLQHIFINQKLHPLFVVIHKSQNTDRAGGDIQKLLHVRCVRKGKAGRADLLGKNAGFEGFAAGDHQQIKVRTLAIAQQ